MCINDVEMDVYSVMLFFSCEMVCDVCVIVKVYIEFDKCVCLIVFMNVFVVGVLVGVFCNIGVV